MIIQIRGTSGSGKSTVVKKIMQARPYLEPHYIEKRKRPLFYLGKGLLILGHYEIACGGCDTIGSVPQIFEVLKTLPPYKHLIMEGLLLSEDVIWTVKLQNEVRSLFLTTSPQESLRRVAIRQEGREPANPERLKEKLESRMYRIEKIRKRLIDAGSYTQRCNSDQAVKIIENWIKDE